jgi:hypothetical protein
MAAVAALLGSPGDLAASFFLEKEHALKSNPKFLLGQFSPRFLVVLIGL